MGAAGKRTHKMRTNDVCVCVCLYVYGGKIILSVVELNPCFRLCFLLANLLFPQYSFTYNHTHTHTHKRMHLEKIAHAPPSYAVLPHIFHHANRNSVAAR